MVVHFDTSNTLVEPGASNASKRINLDRLRSSPDFVEIDPERTATREEALRRIKEIAEEADIDLYELAISHPSPTYHYRKRAGQVPDAHRHPPQNQVAAQVCRNQKIDL